MSRLAGTQAFGASRAVRLRRRVSGLLGALAPILIGFALAVLLSGSQPVERLRNNVFDQYMRWAPRVWSPDLPVRIIDVDDASLARIGQWPWPRQKLADLTNILTQAGAAAIVFDMLLSEPDRAAPATLLSQLPASPERDTLAAAMAQRGELDADPLAQAIAQAPVVLAAALTKDAGAPSGQPKTRFVILGDDPAPALPRFGGVITPLPALREAASGLGVINYLPDMDLILRKAPLVLGLETGGELVLFPALSAEALRIAFQTQTPLIKVTNASGERSFGDRAAIVAVKIGEAEIPTEQDGSVRIRFAGEQPGRRISAWKALAGEVARDEIEGRIILIGSSAAALSDLRSTPLDAAVPGVEVHAELLEHALTGARLARPDWAPGAEGFAILLGGALLAFASRRLAPSTAALAALALIAGGALASWQLFTRHDLLFDPLLPGLSWAATYMAATFTIYRRTEREKRFVRAAFQRYLAPAVVEQLAQDPSKLQLGGETIEATILFSDVRDFTARSEGMDAQGVVRFLNTLHTPLTAAVLAQGGAIDKYIGDGLMAFWNAPIAAPDHANMACAAALAMADAITGVDAQVRAQAEAANLPHSPVQIGIGVSTGQAFVGNMGSIQRFDYSMVGDTVNVAARLETATKACGVSIIVSEATAQAARDFHFVDLGPMDLKGKALSARAFALHAKKGNKDSDFQAFTALHHAALEALMEGAPDAAARAANAAEHPEGARYAAFYRWRSQARGAAPILSGKNPGGS